MVVLASGGREKTLYFMYYDVGEDRVVLDYGVEIAPFSYLLSDHRTIVLVPMGVSPTNIVFRSNVKKSGSWVTKPGYIAIGSSLVAFAVDPKLFAQLGIASIALNGVELQPSSNSIGEMLRTVVRMVVENVKNGVKPEIKLGYPLGASIVVDPQRLTKPVTAFMANNVHVMRNTLVDVYSKFAEQEAKLLEKRKELEEVTTRKSLAKIIVIALAILFIISGVIALIGTLANIASTVHPPATQPNLPSITATQTPAPQTTTAPPPPPPPPNATIPTPPPR